MKHLYNIFEGCTFNIIEMNTMETDFSLNLREATLKELRFLAVINRYKGLLDEGNMLDWAIFR